MGLTIMPGMTAAAWQYIGSQGILQGTYETFMAIARRHFGGSLARRLLLTSGCGGMSGAQPLAGKLAGASTLVVEVDEERIERRIATGYCDRKTADLNEALRLWIEARDKREPLALSLCGNAAAVLPEIERRGITPDIVTDQTFPEPLKAMSRSSFRSTKRALCERAIPSGRSHSRAAPSPSTRARCSPSWTAARSSSNMATDFASKRERPASPTRSACAPS